MSDFLHMAQAFLAEKALAAAVLAVFVTILACFHSPQAKMIIFSLPVPFTCAYLQSHIPINPTHVTGMILVSLYHWIVFTVARLLKLPLWLAIGAGVLIYVASAFFMGSAQVTQPFRQPRLFLPMIALALCLWTVVLATYRPAVEPGHRGTTPWYIKSPLIFVISLGIFSLTKLLSGAVTTFPYAGVFTSYEMRHSLRTLAGQFSINIVAMMVVFVVMWFLEQHHLPHPWPLVAGWAVLIPTLLVIYRLGLGRPREPLPLGD